ncbi:PepSY domain-containing protein [Lysinibacillus fusiformis]|uniref:PepSY domain-containing protein n=1 Tax=Lysinibacillus TaxID=400634 RepID=UPI001966D743|nr:PepSY domain-containing protein [Lysinibacillus fusiformis]QSB11964.1 PepSY domain-containing protein [Lysinibacillus fusiformis]
MKKWMLIIVVIILLCSGVIWFIQNRYFYVQPLSEAEAVRHIETIYNGHVTQVKKQGNTFEMLFTRENVKYAAILDVTTQQVTNLIMKEGQSKLLLTEKQIRQMVKKEYGDVESVMLTDSVYTVRVENEKIQKDLTLDGYTGDVLAERKVETQGQSIEEPIITEQQAIQIALKQLKGEVDSVDFEETSEGGYYLVEIETQEDEATFQIHAVSGKVLSVTWDDDQ